MNVQLSQRAGQNSPGELIVTRRWRARFYCVACFQAYQKCKCLVYVSADTVWGGKSGMPRRGAEAI
jgi:hypothetical protein